MTGTHPDTRFQEPLRTDDQLRLTLEDLLLRADRRQLWILFLDDEHRLAGPIMPGDGYPQRPELLVEADDLGPCEASTLLAVRLHSICEIVEAAAVVLVWETPDTIGLDDDTRAWVRDTALACREFGTPLRAQLHLDEEGMRMLVLDDYI